jgi:hypothetical protein
MIPLRPDRKSTTAVERDPIRSCLSPGDSSAGYPHRSAYFLHHCTALCALFVLLGQSALKEPLGTAQNFRTSAKYVENVIELWNLGSELRQGIPCLIGGHFRADCCISETAFPEEGGYKISIDSNQTAFAPKTALTKEADCKLENTR